LTPNCYNVSPIYRGKMLFLHNYTFLHSND
jgi:hypothetical protein